MTEWFLSLSERTQMFLFVLPTIVGIIIGIFLSRRITKYVINKNKNK